MSGTNPRLTPLESRKQILIAESELNRAQLGEDVAALKTEVGALTEHAKSFGALASSAAILLAGVAAIRQARSVFAVAKPSWRQTIVKGAGLVSTMWLALRAAAQKPKDP